MGAALTKEWLTSSCKLALKKATSENLPEVNIIYLGIFIGKDSNFISPEIFNVKAIRNGRESAIGFVQVKREGHIHC